jgi:polar amino acid transport system permease protein
VAETFFDADAVGASATLLRLGLVHTLRLVGMAFLVALGLGAVALWARTRTASWLRRAGIAYVDLVRATPPIVLLVVVYYALPAVGLPSLDAFQTGWLSLGLVQGAYVSEVYRAGWLAVEPGQRLAARALGLTEAQAARFVLIPQVARVVLPPLTGQLAQLVRDSPLTLVIGYPELLTRAREAQALLADSTPLVAAGLLFLALLLVLQGVGLWVERGAPRGAAAP